MNKTEFINALSKELGKPKTKTSAILASVLDLMTKVMKDHDELKIAGFGTFKAKSYPPSITRTPMGTMTDLPSRRRVRFVVSNTFKKIINGHE